jgi:YegS/Rv2252/BmrU family lipid kinase
MRLYAIAQKLANMYNYPMKTLLFVFNPKAGLQALNARLFDVVDVFSAAGYLVTVYPTQAGGEMGAIIASLARGYDVLVCAGGDGSVSEAVSALSVLEKPPRFGYIPTGTVNDFAASLGIPTDILNAVQIILNGSPGALDIGCFENENGKRHFIYVAAFGLFTDVSYSTSQAAKNILGKLAYFLEGAKRFGQTTAYACEFELDGEIIAGDFILAVVANTHSIAGIKMPKGIETQMDDGLFDVILIKKPANLKESGEVIASLLAQEEKSPLVTFRKVKKMRFHATEAVPWTLDGDFGGEYNRVMIENLHRAVEVIYYNTPE